jgi:hypothetical protein
MPYIPDLRRGGIRVFLLDGINGEKIVGVKNQRILINGQKKMPQSYFSRA